jgi:hypothetical protein
MSRSVFTRFAARPATGRRTRAWSGPAALVAAALAFSPLAGGPAAAAGSGDARLAAGPAAPMIVLLAAQHRELSVRGPAIATRRHTLSAEQQPLIDQARRAGARALHAFTVVNGFAGTMTQAEADHLRADHRVRAVVPDLVVHAPRQPAELDSSARAAAAASPRKAASGAGGGCTKDPAAPTLEPEALQLTDTAYTDPNLPQANSLADGRGVTVAFLAEGVNVNSPDLVRADGSRVVVDHQDFSGEGYDAPASAAEAYGDASGIAAQGRATYDLHTVFSPTAPTGCTIRVRGVAPGASLVALKVFGSSDNASSGRLLQAIDYAVGANVDVINESFGGNPYPDPDTDPVALADEAAVAAGITVVASTGDAGPNGTIGSPASDPAVISAAASTSFRDSVQAGMYGSGFSTGTWQSDNISALSSGGVSQRGRVPDLSAPGDMGWAICDQDVKRYTGCGGKPIQAFGGTSQAAPFISGGAALVIQAYAATHGGVRPTPALVKQILTSTATDIDAPGYEQGAGLLNSYAAVRAAASVHDGNGSPRPTGTGLLVGETAGDTQLAAAAAPGEARHFGVSVVNTGSVTQHVRAAGRTLSRTVSDQLDSVSLDTTSPKTPTFYDGSYGGVRFAYTTRTFTVPSGVDRLELNYAYPGDAAKGLNQRVRITLISPQGAFAAQSFPQGVGDYARAQVRDPAPGVWTAIVYGRQNAFNGRVVYQVRTLAYAGFGSVSPASLVLRPGERGVFDVTARTPAQPGDVSAAVRITQDLPIKQDVSVPLTLRATVSAAVDGGRFSGVLTGGNGRSAAPGQTSYFSLDVPGGKPNMAVNLRFAGDPNLTLHALLVNPAGAPVAITSNVVVDERGKQTFTNALSLYRDHPAAGRWALVLEEDNLVGGAALSQQFTGALSFGAVDAKASGLPHGARLPAGKPVSATVRVRNTGTAAESFFADGRLEATGRLPILPDVPGSDRNITFSVDGGTAVSFTAPTQLDAFSVTAAADGPVGLDLAAYYGAPELFTLSEANSTTTTALRPNAPAGRWLAAPQAIGPFDSGGAPKRTGSLIAEANGRLFDPALSASTGDRWLRTVRADAPYRPLVLAPGQSGVITVRIVPTGKPGAQVRGTLFVDDFSAATGSGDELTGIPYSYTIG